jgi:hypothetical protein
MGRQVNGDIFELGQGGEFGQPKLHVRLRQQQQVLHCFCLCGVFFFFRSVVALSKYFLDFDFFLT